MKLILILLFSFNLHAQVTPCNTETLNEIDACTVEDKLPMLIGRLFPLHRHKSEQAYTSTDPCNPLTIDDEDTEEIEVCPVWLDPKINAYYYEEQDFDSEGNPEFTFYQRLVMLNKPLVNVFEDDLLVWANENKVVVNWKTRVNSITRVRRGMSKCGYSGSNLALFKNSLIDNIGDVRVDCLESKIGVLDMEDAHQVMKDKRRKDRAFGDDLVEEVLLLIPNETPQPQKMAMLAKLAPIQTLLQLGDVDGAKISITAEIVDVSFTQGLKDFMLSKINTYLGE